jgi:16S rRNA (adenine1518-N6/adenine1519-N6)-dimethyltransferase
VPTDEPFPAQSSEEIFDVCDEADQVIGQLPRSLVHARKLLHRAVHVFVFNACGELLLQLRSAEKDEYPLCYTSSASGHLGAGESYDEAAPRELEEELGLTGYPLERLHKFPAGPETSFEHTVLYRTTAETIPRIDPREIAEARFLTLDEIAILREREPQKFSPCLLTLLDWYHHHIGCD